MSHDGYEFMNPDDPLSLNMYTYGHNNPLKFIDPSGHEAISGTLITMEFLITGLAAILINYGLSSYIANDGSTVIINTLEEYYDYKKAGGYDVVVAEAQVQVLLDAKSMELTNDDIADSNNKRWEDDAVEARDGDIAVGVKFEEKVKTHCVEDLVVEQLMKKGAKLEDIVMTPAIRPRTMEVVPVCIDCQAKYKKENFLPLTPYKPGGAWDWGN